MGMTLQAPIGSISPNLPRESKQTLEKETKCQNHNNPFYYYIQASFSFSVDYCSYLFLFWICLLIKTIAISVIIIGVSSS